MRFFVEPVTWRFVGNGGHLMPLLFHRPSRSGADLAALLGYGPRQALGSPTLQRESLGDVLSRSLPKTLQEVLAHSLGVDPDEQQAPEPDPQGPEVDSAAADTESAPPSSQEPFKLPPLVQLPDLPPVVKALSRWAAPLALTPGENTGNANDE